MKLRFTRQARRHIDATYDYVARHDTGAAESVLLRIESAFDRLIEYPQMGRVGRVAGTRELVIPGLPYIIVYRLRSGTLDVLAIQHTARSWPDNF